MRLRLLGLLLLIALLLSLLPRLLLGPLLLHAGRTFAPTLLRGTRVTRIEWPGPALIVATGHGVLVSPDGGSFLGLGMRSLPLWRYGAAEAGDPAEETTP